jgi:hypothetical protein
LSDVFQAQVGNQGPLSDGVTTVPRAGKEGALCVSEYHGRHYEQAYRKAIFTGANQAAATWSVALNATHTGLVLSNPAGSLVNLVVLRASFALSVAPVGIASIGLFGGFLAAGITVHTTPLTPYSTFIGSGATPSGKIDSAATLPGTPVWLEQILSGFTAGALPGAGQVVDDLGGLFIVPPGGYVGIGALTAALGFGSISWAEVAI